MSQLEKIQYFAKNKYAWPGGTMTTTTKSQKALIRKMLRARYGDGCRPQIDKQGGCSIWRSKGNGTHMRNGKDLTVGRIFMGWDTDLIEEVSNA